MRSRDGNSYLTRAICSIILLNSLALNAEEFLVSYRYVTKDAMHHSQLLHISKAMKKCDGVAQKPLILPTNEKEDFKLLISENQEVFLDYIHKIGIQIEHKEKTKNLQNSSITILTLKTTCFKVDFNDTFAKITPLK